MASRRDLSWTSTAVAVGVSLNSPESLEGRDTRDSDDGAVWCERRDEDALPCAEGEPVEIDRPLRDV
jgi:phage terminase large subunit-like protein